MSNAELTHTEKLMLAEVTTALSQLVINKLNELKLEYGAGVMTPKDMAQSLTQLANNAHLLLDNFAGRFRPVEKAGLASSVDAWSDNYFVRAQSMQQKIDEGDAFGALQMGLGIVSKVGKSGDALEIVGSHFGEGGVSSLKNIGKLANGLNKAITAAQLCEASSDGRRKDIAGIVINSLAASLVYGGVSLLLGAAATPVVVVIAVAAVAAIAGDVVSDAFDEFATMFGWEDPENASEIVRQALEVGNQAVLAHVGDKLFWGLDVGDDYVGLSGKRNDMVGAAGNDSLTGADKRDYLNGGADNDDLVGKDDGDKLYGGDGTDTLNGGAGDDMLKGGTGQDTYVFTTDDLAQAVSTDIIEDDDGNGSIVIDGTDVASMTLSEYVDGDSGVIAWQADDYKYLFTYSDADHTLIITLGESGSRIVVRDWSNGDLGIDLPELEETHPPQSAPLTTGNDLFGHNGNNSGDNQIAALAGNDGLSAGAGDDFIDGGDDKDLIYGGSGNDTLLGGLGADIIIDDSEFLDLEDWSDEIGDDGKSQRQREQARISQLGSAVVAKGKGWYVYIIKDGNVTSYQRVTAGESYTMDPDHAPSGNDSINGGLGDDVIWSGEGSDTIKGGIDDDYINGCADDDYLFGGDGADLIWGDTSVKLIEEGSPVSIVSANAQQNGNDAIDGGRGNDSIDGAGGNDLVGGGGGNDILRGNGNVPGALDDTVSDADYMTGGDGKDTIFGDDGKDTIRGGADDDLISGDNQNAKTPDGDDLLYGDGGNDSITGDGADDVLYGGEGEDSLLGDSTLIDGSKHGNDVLFGEAGNDAMAGGGGDDVLLGGYDNDRLIGDNDASVLGPKYDGDDYLSGGKGDDTLLGDGGNDTLFGGEDVDQLFGNSGNDMLFGAKGDDQLLGLEGDDSLDGGEGFDVLGGGKGKDTLNGGDGNDSLWGLSGGDVLDGGMGDDELAGDGKNGSDETTGPDGNDALYGYTGNDILVGNGGNDELHGGHGIDQLSGDAGNDLLFGGDGDDSLRGGAGNDTMDGGAGNDHIQVINGQNAIDGGDGDDTLVGGSGDDTLTGGAGNDLLVGGIGGNNTYIFDAGFGADKISLEQSTTAEAGSIQFRSGIRSSDLTYTLVGDDLVIKETSEEDVLLIQDYFSPNVSLEIKFSDDTIISKTDLEYQFGLTTTVIIAGGNTPFNGTNQADRIYGDATDNVIYGLAGNDYINGEAGNDALFSGVGQDVLEGGLGDDTYYTGIGFTEIVGLGDPDSGNDTVIVPILYESVINYQVSGDDLFVFSNLANVKLDGFLSQTSGTHVIRFANGKEVTAGYFEQGTDPWSSTSGNDNLEGNASRNHIYGRAGEDTILGGAGNDYIEGGAGYDLLEGQEGNDTLFDVSGQLKGGKGDDTYIVLYAETTNPRFDLPQIEEKSDEGNDTVYTNAYDVALPNNVENLVALSSRWLEYHPYSGVTEPRNLVGNDLNNKISVALSPLPDNYEVSSRIVYKLDGGAGIDTLVGSIFDDIYVVDNPDDVIIEPDAASDSHSFDVVQASYSYHLGADEGIDELQLIGTDDISGSGTDGDDILDGSTSSGANTLTGGAGDDSYYVDEIDTVVETANGGTDTVILAGSQSSTLALGRFQNVENAALSDSQGSYGGSLYGNDGDNTLTGNGFSNDIEGGLGNDSIFGGDHKHGSQSNAHDQLYGNEGNDTLRASSGGADYYGGAGDDLFIGGDGADVFHYAVGQGTDTIDTAFTGAADRVVFDEAISTQDVTYSRDGAALIVHVGTNPDDQLRVLDYWASAAEDAPLSGKIGRFLFVFGDGMVHKGNLGQLPLVNNPPVTMRDSLGFDATEGREVTFTIPSDSFTDTSDDTLTLSVANAPSWLSFDSDTGVLTGTPPVGADDMQFKVIATDSWGQTTSAMVAVSVYHIVTGTDGNDNLIGKNTHDEIQGLGGNDVLDDDGHIDRLIGGTGDDTYTIHNSYTIITEAANEGTDSVNASSDYMLGANIEHLVLMEGSAARRGTGNESDNIIQGNSDANELDGGGGADTLIGGTGDDTYVVDSLCDSVVEQIGQGTDTVKTTVDYILGSTLENLVLVGDENINGTGNAKNNVLTGNAGNNRLDGGAGADTLSGGAGDDTFVVDGSDKINEAADAGNDTVERHFETNLVLANNVENLILADGVKTGNGNDLDNLITGNAGANTLGGWDGNDMLQGLDGDDALFGGTGNDTLLGGAGGDYLDGEAGVGHLEGGVGNDNYIVDNGSDVVVEAASAGLDQVQASASYMLSTNVENLFLMGSAAIDGTGNDLNNYIAGNGAVNAIDGGGGNDTLVGDAGADTLAGGTGDDKYVINVDGSTNVIDNADGGFDGIFFSDGITRDRLSFARDGDDLLIFVDDATTPAARVQDHFLGGDSAIDYVQPDGGNYLTTTQINQMVAGNQSGGTYDQVVEGTSAGEQLAGSTGKDLVKGLGGDDTLFGMAGDDALKGGDGNDYLAGGNGSGSGSADDQLEGGAGNDTLTGEDGSNALTGGTGNDKYVYGGGQDTIDNADGGNDGIFFNDGITVDDLAFTRDGDDLIVTASGDVSKTVRVTNHFLGGDAAIDYIQPASGSLLDTAAINALVGARGSDGGDNPPPDTGDDGDGDYGNVVDGTTAGEQLLGSGGRDLIHGLGGNDTVFGFGGDDKFEGGDGDDYLSGGNGSFSGSGNDILIGDAGVDTLVGEDGSDTLIGGAGGDKYLWQAGSGVDLIDNAGGGTDWLFFNGVDPSRLAYHRDGDDLVIMVDDDPSQGVRVQDHFLGGDMVIDYVQPGSGYAIPASQIDGLLTPMPGAGVQMLASVEQPEAVASLLNTWRSDRGFYERWRDMSGGSSPLTSRDTFADAHTGASTFVDANGSDGQPAAELHRLIEAMASFDPASAAVLDDLTVDDPGHPARVGALGAGILRPRESTVHEYVS